MKVNADKFQAIIFGCKNNDMIFNINDIEICDQNEVKLLGITFDHKLSFDTHVSDICRKAGKQLCVLRRLSSTLDQECKLLIYNTFIFSNFNYCSSIWHFCNVTCSKKIEKIQERALRYIYNDYASSYYSLINKSSKSILYINRLRVILQFVYKILHRNVPSYLYDMCMLDDTVYETRMHCKIIQRKFKTITHGYKSFSYQGAKLWNLLPNNMKECTSFKMFKSLIMEWKGPTCICSTCILCKLQHV